MDVSTNALKIDVTTDTGVSLESVFVRDFSSKKSGVAQLQVTNEADNVIILLKEVKDNSIKREIKVDKYCEFYVVSDDSCILVVDADCFMIQFKDQHQLNNLHESIKKIKPCLKTSVFSERTEEASAVQYFQFYGYMSQQQNMLQDYIRTNTYQKAFFKNSDDFKDKIVLDVGSGCGILSFFAVHAGARLVYAVEASSMAHHSKVLVNANNFQDKIKVISGRLEDIELPEKVDVIVSEPLGYMLFNERMIETYLFSKKWLKPGGIMFPSRGDLHIAPFMDDALFMEITSKAKFWDQTSFHNVDLSSLKEVASNEYFHQPVVDSFDIRICLSKSIRYSVDFSIAKEQDLHHMEIPLDFSILETGTIHGLAFWFEAAFVGSKETIWLSTSPTEPLTHWYQVRCLLKSPLAAKAGQRLVGNLLLTANKKQSYDIFIELGIDGCEDTKSFNYLDLKNPYFRYASHTPIVSSTSPSEAYWAHLDQQNEPKQAAILNPESSPEDISLDLSVDCASSSEKVSYITFINDDPLRAPKVYIRSEVLKQRSVLCPATSSTGGRRSQRPKKIALRYSP
ncbi:histone-arginine methyltransferase CARMER [Halyomorpha halys]|uniref:histone-arginine methyltransferase CARMER n=1 Tax=Halyomorpha halys TaxID=286706 RepID=UPI0006D51536|nr:histone-arginine methyltransferase CARMER-like [Halyomorpha halys]